MPHRADRSVRTRSVRVPRVPRLLASGGLLTALLAVALLLSGFSPAGAATRTTATAATTPRPAAPAHHGHGRRPLYYVALGDSLAQGVQPATNPLPPGVTLGQSIETNAGYANDLEKHYQRAFGRRLTLVKLGCPGETTTSMLTGTGSPCSYPQGSQLAAAVAFIAAHRSQIALITIDIGANDIDVCASATSISQSCVVSGLQTIAHNFPLILGALRQAAGPRTEIAGMNLYDPFLAAYLTGSAGQQLATESVSVDQTLNQLLAQTDQAFGVQTADVQDAFSTTDFSTTVPLPGVGSVPLNVARICEWTWMCAPAPVGPNIHANATGYQVIARAFERAIGRLGRHFW
jgi:lysophospholipase L1-like esterase